MSTVRVGDQPTDLGANLSSNRIYVANKNSDTVSVIDAGTNAVIGIVPVIEQPSMVDVNVDNNQIHVTNEENSVVSVIDGATNIVIATLPVGDQSTYTITDA